MPGVRVRVRMRVRVRVRVRYVGLELDIRVGSSNLGAVEQRPAWLPLHHSLDVRVKFTVSVEALFGLESGSVQG